MASGENLSFGQRLRRERDNHHWTQKHLSEKLVGDESKLPSINRWEHDRGEPHAETQAMLCAVFGKPVELWGVQEQKSPLWHVPYLYNPYFTGREQVLNDLHTALRAERTNLRIRYRALSGLGGIGKTQTALEYAYRYGNEYEAVLWVGADSHHTLISDFAMLATTLTPQEKEMDQVKLITVVKNWLQAHGPWLLIFDNAEDLTMVFDFLPRLVSGAILLTTRSQNTGLHITPIPMEKMSRDEGVTFLRRRITARGDMDDDEALSQSESALEVNAAQDLWELMDGLPLALDQAGAYIKAGQSSISEYANLYRQHRQEFHRERGGFIPEHPDAVATTWSFSFQQVKQKNPVAAELLRLCAFLSPDAIPEELLTREATHWTAPLQALASSPKVLTSAISTLRLYSLVQRDPITRTLSTHRLVQAVLIDDLSADIRKQWKERIIRAVNEAFPAAPFQEWTQCERLLPQVLICATWIEQEPIAMQETSSLFEKAGAYLRERGQYVEAELLLTRALAIREQLVGADHLDTATSMSNLAGLYSYQSKYEQAESLVRQALAIREHLLGAEHLDTATSLGHLAVLCLQQRKDQQAEQLFQRVIAIYEQQLGEHPQTAKQLNNLGVLYVEQQKYQQAEPLYRRALLIYEQKLGEHIETARSLSNLAELSMKQGKDKQAEPLYRRALAMHERLSGSESAETAYPLFGLAELSQRQRDYEQAEQLYLRTLAIREQVLEADHPDTAASLQGVADLYHEQGRNTEAKPLYQRALDIYERTGGPSHPETMKTRKHFIALLHAMGLHEEATQLEATQSALEQATFASLSSSDM